MNQYAQIYADVYKVDIESAKSAVIAKKNGSIYTNKDNTSSRIYIDDKKNKGALDTSKTMGHEVAHARMNQGQTRQRETTALQEEYADTFGKYSSEGMSFSSSTYNNVTLNNSLPTKPIIRTAQDTTTLINNTVSYYNDMSKADSRDGRIDNDVVVPVNGRNSEKGDAGHNPNNPYTKYDFLSLDYDDPEKFAQALQKAGYNSVDEFRNDYDSNPNDPNVKAVTDNKVLGKIDNMTHHAGSKKKTNRGSIQGNSGKWGEVLDAGGKYKYGIRDIGEDYVINADGNEETTYDTGYPFTSDEKTTYASKFHCDPTTSEGCSTKTNKINTPENIKQFERELEEKIPSLTDNTERTFMYVAPKNDNYQNDKDSK